MEKLEKKVIITQKTNNCAYSDSVFETKSRGILRLRDTKYELIYFERIEENAPAVQTVIGFDGSISGILSISRFNNKKNTLIFNKNLPTLCTYNVANYEIELFIKTSALTNTVDFENGGKIKLEYTLDNAGEIMSVCDIEIDVQPVN